MSNIISYLSWRGDIKLSRKYPFNEVDSLIMARLSYLPLDKIKLNSKETIASICDKLKSLRPKDFVNVCDRDLVMSLSTSPRFQNMLVTDYVKNIDKEAIKQYASVTIHISPKEMYISYMGTDTTINGWQEDFNMAFMDNVPCQIEGVEYLSHISSKYPRKKIYLGGHSKGGNVAIYSYIASISKIQNRVIKVSNYDGPGFNENIFQKYGSAKILSPIETYIPQESVIGRFLSHQEKMTIVLSQKGLLGHDIYSWEVMGTTITKSQITYISENIDSIVTDWLSNTTPMQRQIFFNTIFELLSSSGADTFNELSQNLIDNIPKIIKKYGEVSAEDKKVITEMLKKILTSNMTILKKEVPSKLDSMKKEYLAKGKEKIAKLDEKYFHGKKDKNY